MEKKRLAIFVFLHKINDWHGSAPRPNEDALIDQGYSAAQIERLLLSWMSKENLKSTVFQFEVLIVAIILRNHSLLRIFPVGLFLILLVAELISSLAFLGSSALVLVGGAIQKMPSMTWRRAWYLNVEIFVRIVFLMIDIGMVLVGYRVIFR